MPTLKHHPPGSNVTPEPPTSSNYYYLEPSGAHIYLALVAVALFIAIRLARAHLGSLQRAPKGTLNTPFLEGKGSLGPETQKDSAGRSPWARDQRGVRLSFGRESHQAVRTAGLLPLGVGARRIPPVEHPPAMDDIDDNPQRKDPLGLTPAASRGVSTSTPGVADLGCQQNPSPGPSTGRRRGSRSPRSSPKASSSRRQSGSPDGASDKRSKGKGPMAGQSAWAGMPQSSSLSEDTDILLSESPALDASARDTSAFDVDYAMSRRFSRPPPPPPLTPPALSSVVYPFEDRRPSYAVSIPPEPDMSFIHQPNPDYVGDSTSTGILSSSPKSATATPRRRSYAKSVPTGIPIPTTTSASSSTETTTSADTFSPSSYPPTSPLLPPPPPGQDFPYEYEFVGGPGGPGILDSLQEIDLHGEIISVMDDAGHGWKRHTRVYGGGVCLACAAAGEQGGFYGDRVPLEDRR